MNNIFNRKEIVLVLIAVLNLIIDVVVCCTLPPFVAFSVNSEMVVAGLSSSWLLLIYPAVSVVVAIVNVLIQSKGSETIKNIAMIASVLIVSLLIYISVIKTDFASQGYEVGDSVNFPIYGITLFPVAIISLILGTKNEKLFGAIFKLNENNKSQIINFTKKMLISYGLILAILCILDFIFKFGIVVLIVAFALAIIVIVTTIIYKKVCSK